MQQQFQSFLQKILIRSFVLFCLFSCFQALDLQRCENNQDVFDFKQDFETQIIQETNDSLIQGNNDLMSKIWTINNDSDHREMFNDQMITMQFFEDQIDVMQLKSGTCFFYKTPDEQQYQVKIVTKRTIGNLSENLIYQQFLQSEVAVVDIIYKIILAVKKIHIKNFLHLNLRLDTISFIYKFTPILDGLEYSMSSSRARNFQFNQDPKVAPEISQIVNQKGGIKIEVKEQIIKLYQSCRYLFVMYSFLIIIKQSLTLRQFQLQEFLEFFVKAKKLKIFKKTGY